jgi:hypothetical protein
MEYKIIYKKEKKNMDLKLEKSTIENIDEIHQMQIKAFNNLWKKLEGEYRQR